MARPKGLLMPLRQYAFKYPELIPTDVKIKGMREKYPDIDWIDTDISHLRKEDGSTDIIELSDFYLEFVRRHHIEILLGSTTDFNTVISSYLAHHCSWLKTCSLESAVMCNSKYLTRKLIAPEEYNLKYQLIKVDSPEDIAEAIKVVGFPMILKPTCGILSEMIKKCENEQDLLKYIHAYKEQERVGKISSYYKQNGKLLLGLEEKYPHLKGLNVLAEEFVEEKEIAFIEYCVQDGKLLEIALCDNIYWPSNPQCFLGCSYPSLYHNETALKSARDMTTKMVQRLQHYGYDNCIGNIEYFILKDGSIKLMEVNPRMSAQTNPTTEDLLHNGDHFRMVFDLQQGIPIKPPTYKFLDDDSAPKAGINLYANSMEEGLASDIFNYSYAEKLQRDPTSEPGLTRCEICQPKHSQITNTSDAGTIFAWCFIVGENYSDCMKKYKPMYHKLFLNSSQPSLWSDEVISSPQ